MKNAITPLLRYELVSFIKANLFPTYANTYLGIGRPIRWGDAADPESNTEIEDVQYTTNYVNQVHRDLIAIKKVEASDIALVVPRVDWVSGTTYDEYDDNIELFSYTDKLTVGTANASGNLVIANTAVFTGNISAGNLITLNAETRQVIGVNATHLIVNTNFTYAVTNGTVVRVTNTYPHFANTFYVRNSKDQVFKCLHHGGSNGVGVPSTIEPTIDIDGQLPENPYILTSDGYKWKYLYTVPYGLKQRFFSKNWMPVVQDSSVVAGAVGGRIDIIDVVSGGSGYFLDGGESGNAASLGIATIVGDGTGAVITARIQSGVITDINILDGGSGYTTATVVINDPNQLANGNVATFDVDISPPGGHGFDPVKELGCYSVMTCVELVGTETDTIPVGSTVTPFDFRQLTLIRDPVLANGSYATGSVYRTTTKLSLTDPGIVNYQNDETVYIGTGIANTTFTATVVTWNATTNELYVNNLSGNVAVGSTLTGANSAASATILGVEDPTVDLFTGDILYIENRQKIVRDPDQTEQIRLVLSF